MPDELKSKISSVIAMLNNLKKTLETYPERKGEIDRFTDYYIPEALRVIVSFNNYCKNGVDEKTISKVYKRVFDSVTILNSAIDQKINDIYRLATMNTVAQADALNAIMGQDGFVKSRNILNH